jgi:hypothetical protein
MGKVIISPGFGGGFYGKQKHRFDPELIRILEEKANLVPGARGNTQRRKDLDAQLVDRLSILNVRVEPAQLAIVELASGKRFKIEEYDGAEYIITEDDLDMVAP